MYALERNPGESRYPSLCSGTKNNRQSHRLD
jgi:hypothetical protein